VGCLRYVATPGGGAMAAVGRRRPPWYGLARVAYVGQLFQVSAPTNFGQPPGLNSYIDTRYECFGGTSAPTLAKTTTTTRHIFTKKTLEGKSRVEKQSEIAIQVEYPLESCSRTKISKVTDCSPQLMISAGTFLGGGVMLFLSEVD
jgi:hypothetical protein